MVVVHRAENRPAPIRANFGESDLRSVDFLVYVMSAIEPSIKGGVQRVRHVGLFLASVLIRLVLYVQSRGAVNRIFHLCLRSISRLHDSPVHGRN